MDIKDCVMHQNVSTVTTAGRLFALFSIITALLLTACGGSDSDTDPTVSTAQNVQAVPGDGQVTLSWDAVAGAVSYSVYWNTTGSVTDAENVVIVTNPLTSHSGLTNNTTYYYRVVASSSSASSALSTEVSATPQSSTLGQSWTAMTSGTTSNLMGISSSGSRYVTGGINESLTSDDGLSWTTHSTLPTGLSFSDFSWDGSQFVAVGSTGSNGFVSTSPDGATWTPRYTVNNKPLHALHWNGTQHVAAGVDAAILSGDWVSSIQVQNAPSTIYGITWDGSQYVAVGDDQQASSETILTSSDIVTWASQSAPSGVDVLNDIIYTGVAYLAVGDSGAIVLSFDGTTWAAQTSGTAEALKSVVWTGNMFVVAGTNGTLLTSNDGVSWTVQTSGVTEDLQDVVWTGSTLVVVGDNGTILNSTADSTPPVLSSTTQSFSTPAGTPLTLVNVTATDAVDGAVAVTQTGTVDFTTIGIYTITYTATDSASNSSFITHTYNVTI